MQITEMLGSTLQGHAAETETVTPPESQVHSYDDAGLPHATES